MKKVSLLFGVLVLLIFSFFLIFSSSKSEDLVFVLENQNVIMHAMGEIDGVEYTNSKEAFKRHYSRGRRVFEVDFALTIDDKIVAKHAKQLNVTEQDFLNQKISGKYTPLNLDMVLDLMVEHQDIFVVTDIKSDFNVIIAEIHKQAVLKDKRILDRIIPQIYSKKTYEQCREIYDFDEIIYTLYLEKPHKNEVLEFIKDKEQISIVTMTKKRFSTREAREINELGKKVFVHTLNEEREIGKLLKNGMGGIYTDSY
jgi:glycerophosphoryl diester phosphodiesterase